MYKKTPKKQTTVLSRRKTWSEYNKTSWLKLTADVRRNGRWRIARHELCYCILYYGNKITTRSRHLEWKRQESSVPWEENFEQPEERNVKRDEELMEECEEYEWETELVLLCSYWLSWFRGKSVLSLLGRRFAYSKKLRKSRQNSKKPLKLRHH